MSLELDSAIARIAELEIALDAAEDRRDYYHELAKFLANEETKLAQRHDKLKAILRMINVEYGDE